MPSPSHRQRMNGRPRAGTIRLSRLTDFFSNKTVNYVCMVALYATFHNFVKAREGAQVTPAMETGLDETVRDFEWIVS